MKAIRWYERFKPYGGDATSVDVVLFLQWPQRAADLSALWHQPADFQTFYRWKRRFDRHDLRTLEARSRRPHQVRQATWTSALAERVLAPRK